MTRILGTLFVLCFLANGCIEIDRAIVESDEPITSSGTYPVTVTVWHEGQPYSQTVDVEFIVANGVPIESDTVLPSDIELEVDIDARIEINSATIEDFVTLPGIGPVKAAAIVAYREEVGRFTDIANLLRVKGIGDKTLAKILPYLYIIVIDAPEK